MFRTGQTEGSVDLARLAGGESGRIYMAIECHSCFEWLLPAINEYRESWPDVELDISSGFHFAPLPALTRGDLDLVITADPVDDLGLAYIPLFSYEAELALARDYTTGNHWLILKLVGTRSNRDAIGARVVFHLPSGKTVWRELRGSGKRDQADRHQRV